MATGYYQKNKKRLQKKARERYQNLSEEKKSVNTLVKCIKVFLKLKKKG